MYRQSMYRPEKQDEKGVLQELNERIMLRQESDMRKEFYPTNLQMIST